MNIDTKRMSQTPRINKAMSFTPLKKGPMDQKFIAFDALKVLDLQDCEVVQQIGIHFRRKRSGYVDADRYMEEVVKRLRIHRETISIQESQLVETQKRLEKIEDSHIEEMKKKKYTKQKGQTRDYSTQTSKILVPHEEEEEGCKQVSQEGEKQDKKNQDQQKKIKPKFKRSPPLQGEPLLDYEGEKVKSKPLLFILDQMKRHLEKHDSSNDTQATLYEEDLKERIEQLQAEITTRDILINKEEEKIVKLQAINEEMKMSHLENEERILSLEKELDSLRRDSMNISEELTQNLDSQNSESVMVNRRDEEGLQSNMEENILVLPGQRETHQLRESLKNTVSQIENLRSELKKRNRLAKKLIEERDDLQSEVLDLRLQLERSEEIGNKIQHLEKFVKSSFKEFKDSNIKSSSKTSSRKDLNQNQHQQQPSYAEVVKTRPLNALIVKNLNPKRKAADIGKSIHDLGMEDIQVSDCERTRSGNLIISCNTDMDLQKIKTKIHNSELRDTIQLIEKTTRVIIFNIPDQITEDEIKNKLEEKYPRIRNLQFVRKRPAGEVFHQVLEMDAVTAMNLLHDRRLLLKMVGCPARKYLSLPRCFRCQRVGHVAQQCKKKNQIACEFCSEGHDSRECKIKEDTQNHKCVNCIRENQRLNKHYTTNHKSSSSDCMYYRSNLIVFRKSKFS